MSPSLLKPGIWMISHPFFSIVCPPLLHGGLGPFQAWELFLPTTFVLIKPAGAEQFANASRNRLLKNTGEEMVDSMIRAFCFCFCFCSFEVVSVVGDVPGWWRWSRPTHKSVQVHWSRLGLWKQEFSVEPQSLVYTHKHTHQQLLISAHCDAARLQKPVRKMDHGVGPGCTFVALRNNKFYFAFRPDNNRSCYLSKYPRFGL